MDLSLKSTDIARSINKEITRIADTTNYAGLKLINGDFSATSLQSGSCLALGYNQASIEAVANGLKFHIGANNVVGDDYYYVNISSMTASALGIENEDVCTTASAQAALDAIDAAITSKDVARTFLGSMGERLQNTYDAKYEPNKLTDFALL